MKLLLLRVVLVLLPRRHDPTMPSFSGSFDLAIWKGGRCAHREVEAGSSLSMLDILVSMVLLEQTALAGMKV
jgi:hypothetical protein